MAVMAKVPLTAGTAVDEAAPAPYGGLVWTPLTS